MRRGLKIAAISIGIAATGVAALVTVALLFGPPSVSDEAIDASVDRQAEHLAPAYDLPVAATFPAPLHYQANGSLCGPASVVNVLRSLGEPGADEAEVLAGTGYCRRGVCWLGLTLDELAEVAATATDRKVTVLRDLSADEFLEHMRRSNDLGRRYVINFHRAPIFGAGGGHHSPIGGYIETTDQVLVLDVNEHYTPWLIDRQRLYEAMKTMDGDLERGLLLIE